MNGNYPLEISVQDVKSLLDGDESFLLLDCREPAEYAIARIDGSQLIPMNEIPARLSEIEGHQRDRIVVHCHHGGRSLQVVQWLRGRGFAGAQNMTGGIDAWSQQIDPSVARYG